VRCVRQFQFWLLTNIQCAQPLLAVECCNYAAKLHLSWAARDRLQQGQYCFLFYTFKKSLRFEGELLDYFRRPIALTAVCLHLQVYMLRASSFMSHTFDEANQRMWQSNDLIFFDRAFPTSVVQDAASVSCTCINKRATHTHIPTRTHAPVSLVSCHMPVTLFVTWCDDKVLEHAAVPSTENEYILPNSSSSVSM
jgi:hypothetical protein